MNRHTTAPIRAARAIVRGDAQRAREEMMGICSVRIAEARALAGACRTCNQRYGSNLCWLDFLATSNAEAEVTANALLGPPVDSPVARTYSNTRIA